MNNRYKSCHGGSSNDWTGDHIDRRLYRKLKIGNTVRIRIISFTHPTFEQAPYITIYKVCGKGVYKGIVTDPYMVNIPGYLYTKGDSVTFSRSHIFEVPLTFKENKQLLRLVGRKKNNNYI